jgi:Carboxypeptidase regulatory-like domain
MRIRFFISFCLLFSAMTGFGQTASLKGAVTDTIEKRNISNSVIALLGKSDSILVSFVRTDKDGNFFLKNLPPGNFILQVSHPQYADYVDEVSLTNSELNLGAVFLTPKSKILEEVIVKQNVAIRIKGDTIEYKADSFKVSEGADVNIYARQEIERLMKITTWECGMPVYAKKILRKIMAYSGWKQKIF